MNNPEFKTIKDPRVAALVASALTMAACSAPVLEQGSQPQNTGKPKFDKTLVDGNTASAAQRPEISSKTVTMIDSTGVIREVDTLADGYKPGLYDIKQTNLSLVEEAPSNDLLLQSIARTGIDINRPYKITRETTAAQLANERKLNPNGMVMTYRKGAHIEKDANGNDVVKGGALGYFMARYANTTQYVNGIISAFGLDECYMTIQGFAKTASASLGNGIGMINLNMASLFNVDEGGRIEKEARCACDQISEKPPKEEVQPTPEVPSPTPTKEIPTRPFTPTPVETVVINIPTPIPSTMDYCVAPGVYRYGVSPDEALNYAISKGYTGSRKIYEPVEGYRVWGNIQAFLAEKCNVTPVPTPEPTPEEDQPDRPNNPSNPGNPSQPDNTPIPKPGDTPVPTETATLMPSQTPVETPTVNATGTPTPRVEPSPTAMATFVTATPRTTPPPTGTATLMATQTPVGTPTINATGTPTPRVEPSPTAMATFVTATPRTTPSPTAVLMPSQTPVETRTPVPTTAATATPRVVPSPTSIAPFVTATPRRSDAPTATPRPNQQPTATLFN